MLYRGMFQSFWIGGLECSSHRLRSGKRLDMLAATRHDQLFAQDYARLKAQGISTLRSGIRWHLIEKRPGQYDFSSVVPMIRAAREQGVQVIWDLCHYGWPDDLDVQSTAFVTRFARLAAAFARVLDSETEAVQYLSPINEISFFAWGGGDAGYLNPHQNGRGFELKVQLVRTAIAGIEAIRDILPQDRARMVHVDPVIQIVSDPGRPWEHPAAEGHRVAQYQAWDMLSGYMWPQLGGKPDYIDVIGANYYSNNQWVHGGPTLHFNDPLYRPLRSILTEVYERYRKPLFIGETGAEDDFRSTWIRYVGSEVAATIVSGIPVEGITLYPVINHPGWDNERHCHNGLFDYADEDGHRAMYTPLMDELHVQDNAIHNANTVIQQRMKSRIAHLSAAINTDVNRRPLRICLFTDSLEVSGMGEHMLLLASGLAASHQVMIIVPPTEANQPFIQRAEAIRARYAIRVECLEVRGGQHGRSAWEQLRDLLRTEQIDIFHAHAGIAFEGHDGFYAAWFADLPVLIRTEHLPYVITDFNQVDRYRALSSEVDHLITVSNQARVTFTNVGVDPARITTIANGVQPHTLTHTREQIRASIGIAPSQFMLLTAGRLTAQKGYHVLLEAIPAILAAQPQAIFVWAGEGALRDELTERAGVLGVSNAIVWLGWRADTRDLIAAADLVVLPSLFEGMPLVALEAMAAGTPFIATRVGGLSSITQTDTENTGTENTGTENTIKSATEPTIQANTENNGTSGSFAPLLTPDDPTALANALIAALKHPEQRDMWAAAGMQRFNAAYSADHMVRDTEKLYQQVVQQAVERMTTKVYFPPALPVGDTVQVSATVAVFS